MGKEAVKFVNRLRDILAESGRIHKGAFVCWAMQLLSVTVQRGNAKMHRRSGLVISCEQGLRYDAGRAVLHGESNKRPGIAKNDKNNGTIKTTNKPNTRQPNSQRTTLETCAPSIRRNTHISQHSTPH